MREGIRDPVEFSRVEQTGGTLLRWPKGCIGCASLDKDEQGLLCKEQGLHLVYAARFCKRSGEWTH